MIKLSDVLYSQKTYDFKPVKLRPFIYEGNGQHTNLHIITEKRCCAPASERHAIFWLFFWAG